MGRTAVLRNTSRRARGGTLRISDCAGRLGEDMNEADRTAVATLPLFGRGPDCGGLRSQNVVPARQCVADAALLPVSPACGGLLRPSHRIPDLRNPGAVRLPKA